MADESPDEEESGDSVLGFRGLGGLGVRAFRGFREFRGLGV